MPIGQGEFVNVLVTHVVSPDEFYVQKVSTSLNLYAVETPPIWTISHVLYLSGRFFICYSIFDRLVYLVKLSSCWRTIAGAGDHGYHKDVASHYNSFQNISVTS